MQTLNKITDCLDLLESEISRAAQRLAEYKAQPKASQRAVAYQQQQVNNLQGVYEALNDFLAEFEAEQNANQQQLTERAKKIFLLEGMCLLHGVTDFDRYMRYSTDEMGNLVKQAYDEGWRQTPFELWDAESPHAIRRFSIIKELNAA